MKLIIAIVQDEDASRLISNLMSEGYSVTKLATTGGFLRAGNTTLLLGIDDEKIEKAMSIIEHDCDLSVAYLRHHGRLRALSGGGHGRRRDGFRAERGSVYQNLTQRRRD